MTQRRGVGKSKQYASGRVSSSRVAWVRTHIAQFNLFVYPKNDSGEIDTGEDVPKIEGEEGEEVFLLIPQPGRRPVMLNFTSLTAEELGKTRQLFNLLFEIAEPIVAHRDKVAQDAYSEGDDSYSRIYRAVPEFVVRERALDQYREKLWGRPEGAPGGDGSPDHLDGGHGGHGQQLADGEPQEGRSQDHPEASD